MRWRRRTGGDARQGDRQVPAHRGRQVPRHPGQVQPRRHPQDRLAEGQEHPRPQPGHVRQRGVLRAAGQGHRRDARSAGRCGRSSAARTCSRTSRCSTRPRRGKASGKQLFDYYLGWLTDPSIKTHFQFIPDSSVAFAQRVGDEYRGGRPAARGAGRGEARWPRGGGRPLARRVDRHRLRHLGLPRQAGRQGTIGTRLHRRREQSHPRDERPGHAVAPVAAGRARRGSRSVGSRRPSPGCSRPPGPRAR